jgi:hypothetical protein
MKKRVRNRVSGKAAPLPRLWGVLIASCIVAFFVIAVIFLSAEFGLIPPLSEANVALLEFVELCAILVFAAELYIRYARTPDKKKFLMQNWLAILAILPLGMFIRSFRAAEGIGLLRPLQSTFRLAETEAIMPLLLVSGRPLLAVHRWLVHFQVFKDFFALAGKWAKRVFR